jgi:hypothetical protein
MQLAAFAADLQAAIVMAAPLGTRLILQRRAIVSETDATRWWRMQVGLECQLRENLNDILLFVL